jgi:hypothetical protein
MTKQSIVKSSTTLGSCGKESSKCYYVTSLLNHITMQQEVDIKIKLKLVLMLKLYWVCLFN